MLKRAAVAVLALALTGAHAQTAFEATVGGTRLVLPVPEGFIEPSKSAPVLLRNAETITAPSMRLVAVFVDEKDQSAVEQGKPPSFRRYFMVQVLRTKETDTLDKNAFADVKSQVAGIDSAALARISEELQKGINTAAKKVGTEAGVDLALEIGKLRQLGVFHETDLSVSTMLVTRVAASTGTQELERLMGLAGSTVLLRGKVVFFAAYSEVNGDSDYKWLRTVSQDWVKSAPLANPQ